MKPSISSPSPGPQMNRRRFLQTNALATAAWLSPISGRGQAQSSPATALSPMTVGDLPTGNSPAPVPLPHFPEPLYAFLWRNWFLVPLARLAHVLQAQPAELAALARLMGLPEAPPIPENQWRRSALTLIRRNWHLLPYAQLLKLLDWPPERMAYTLREDDFFYIKLGSHKPKCTPLRYQPPTPATQKRLGEIGALIGRLFPRGLHPGGEHLFEFVEQLSSVPPATIRHAIVENTGPRFCYSYFALYGDPLLEPKLDPYPNGLLARLTATGVNGVWLPAILYKLAPFPWNPELSRDHQRRLDNLGALVARARRQGMAIYLYLNEPRAMPLRFFDRHPELRGVTEGDHAALCTSRPEVRNYLTHAVAQIVRAVPDLAGFFTITASENLTNCWSHHHGTACPRCGKRPPAAVIAEVNNAFHQGIQTGGSHARLLVWDWGWGKGWTQPILRRLPRDAALMSVSEWGIPIDRGGVKQTVGEYSISVIGPGARAQSHWKEAHALGLGAIAKVQAGNTWELSTVPYIPALHNVALHAARLSRAHVDGLMLGWTLGGYPSPNLEVMGQVAELASKRAETGKGSLTEEALADEALRRVARRRFGVAAAPAVVQAWKTCSRAFREYPFSAGVVYHAPIQYGPANLLWARPTGYRATMTGIPYDDLKGWRDGYPEEVFISQFDKVARGFSAAHRALREAIDPALPPPGSAERAALLRELKLIEASALHFESTANQARFVRQRRELLLASHRLARRQFAESLAGILRRELHLALRLHSLQCDDSRLGFEASNQYFYVPSDLAEKAINCRYLLDHWLQPLGLER